jgi:integrase
MKPGIKDVLAWDTALPGFGLKSTPTGSKIYVLQYRSQGRVRRYTIGPHGQWTPDTARKQAAILFGQLAKGTDPADEKGKHEGLTLAQCAERYLADYARLRKKPRSIKEDERNLRRLVLPTLGTKRLDAITRQDLARLHHGLRETPTAANRVRSLLHTMFTLDERWGLRPDGSNPCRYIQKYAERKRQRFLSEKEFFKLGKALHQVGKANTFSPFVIAGIRLLIFTGARLNEILTLRWNDVDMDRQQLNLPDSKTGAKTLHLNAPALTILHDLPRIEGNEYVLPGLRHKTHLQNIHRPWFIIRDKAGLSGVRLHDLRHSYASVGADGGLGLPIIGGLLGHTQAGTTQRYAHLSNDPLKKANDSIGDRIQTLMSGQNEQTRVIPLTRPRRETRGCA